MNNQELAALVGLLLVMIMLFFIFYVGSHTDNGNDGK